MTPLLTQIKSLHFMATVPQRSTDHMARGAQASGWD